MWGRQIGKFQVFHSPWLVGTRLEHGRLTQFPALDGAIRKGMAAVARIVLVAGFGLDSENEP